MDDNSIAAKPVTWRDQNFDSQLEADWAASLTVWEVDWRFHPGFIEVGDGRLWEPDFLLRNAGAWGEDILFEVKGPHDNRIDKPQLVQEQHPDLIILIGRVPYLDAADDSQYPGAVWSRPDGSGYLWELNGKDVTYVSGELATYDVPGLIFFKAIGDRQIK